MNTALRIASILASLHWRVNCR